MFRYQIDIKPQRYRILFCHLLKNHSTDPPSALQSCGYTALFHQLRWERLQRHMLDFCSIFTDFQRGSCILNFSSSIWKMCSLPEYIRLQCQSAQSHDSDHHFICGVRFKRGCTQVRVLQKTANIISGVSALQLKCCFDSLTKQEKLY